MVAVAMMAATRATAAYQQAWKVRLVLAVEAARLRTRCLPMAQSPRRHPSVLSSL